MYKWTLGDTQDFIHKWVEYGEKLNSLYNNRVLNLSSAKDQAKCKYINNCLLEEIAEYMDANPEHKNHRMDELADVCNFLSWLRFATNINPESIITEISKPKYQFHYLPIQTYAVIGSFTMYGLMQMNLLHNREWVEDETPLDETRFKRGILSYITDIIYFISCQEFKVNEVLDAIDRKYQVNYKRIKNNY